MMWKSIVKTLIIITITLYFYCKTLLSSNIIIKYIKYVKKCLKKFNVYENKNNLIKKLL